MPIDPNGGGFKSKYPHAYAYSVDTGNVTLIDHAYGETTPGSRGAYPYDISADGRYVVINSDSKNLTPQTVEQFGNIYRYDTMTGENLLLTKSVVTGKVGGDSGSRAPVMNRNGEHIAFYSFAKNLLSATISATPQIYLYDITTAQMKLVSRAAGNPALAGDDGSFSPRISDDGNYVAFDSRAKNLVPNFGDGNDTFSTDVFFYNRLIDQTTLLSRNAATPNISGNDATYISAVSADGSRVVFSSGATDLIVGFTNNNGVLYDDIYEYDRMTNSVSLVSGRFGSVSAGANDDCQSAEVSADGSTIAFATPASDIMPGLYDADGADDVFLRDVATGNTIVATRRFGSPSLSPGGESAAVQVSADGRYLVFTSKAPNIVPGQVDPNDSQDIFVFDRQTQTTQLVSHAYDSLTTAADNESAIPVISADGRYVAYTSYASNLIANFVDGNGNGVPGNGLSSGVDVYLFDRVTGANTLVSHQAANPGAGGNQTSGVFAPFLDHLLSINADGRYVGYFSLATDLIAGFVNANGTTPQNNTGSDVFVYDRTTGANTLVSHKAGSAVTTSNDSSYAPSISGDGRYIAFWSFSYTMVPGMAATHIRNVFIYDQQTGQVSLASHTAASTTFGGNAGSSEPAISKDGIYVLYQSYATNLVGGSDTNGQQDIFLYNRATNTNTLVSHTATSPVNAGNAISRTEYGNIPQSISDDGRFAVYYSAATDLVGGFVSGHIGRYDVFLFDRVTGSNTLVSRSITSATTGANRYSLGQAISGDGRYVAFASDASNVVAGFVSPGGTFSPYNVYIFDRLTGITRLASHDMSAMNVGGNGYSGSPSVSQDGSVIAMLSDASNLVPGDFNSHQDVIAFINTTGVQSVTIANGSAQRSVVRSMTIAFDQFIPIVGDPALAFEVKRVGAVSGLQLAVSVSNNPNTTVTLTFSGPGTEFGSLMDGKYTLTAFAAAIPNLDGNNDGFAGDDYVFNFHRLFGDADGNGTVNTADFAALRTAFGSSSFIFDFNNTGSLDTADFNQFRTRFGASV